MTELLQRAIAEIQRLPADVQDAIAVRILADLEDEQAWSEQFAATSDGQWGRMVDQVQHEIRTGDAVDLADVFPSQSAKG